MSIPSAERAARVERLIARAKVARPPTVTPSSPTTTGSPRPSGEARWKPNPALVGVEPPSALTPPPTGPRMVMSRSIANWSWDNAPSSSSQSSLPESINASAEPEPADGAELTPQPPQSLPTPPPTAAADAHVRELVGLPPHCEQLGVQAHARLAQIEATKAALVAALDAEAGQLKSLLSLLDAQSTVQRTHTAAIVEIAAALEALAAPERPANVLSALTGGADAAELQRALATQAHNALGQLCANAAAAARDGGLPPAEHAETAAARALLGARPAPVSVGSPQHNAHAHESHARPRLAALRSEIDELSAMIAEEQQQQQQLAFTGSALASPTPLALFRSSPLVPQTLTPATGGAGGGARGTPGSAIAIMRTASSGSMMDELARDARAADAAVVAALASRLKAEQQARLQTEEQAATMLAHEETSIHLLEARVRDLQGKLAAVRASPGPSSARTPSPSVALASLERRHDLAMRGSGLAGLGRAEGMLPEILGS